MASNKVRNSVLISLLAASSFILMYVLQIPLVPAAPYLQWDPSDLPNVLGGLVLGPGAAIAISLVKSLLYLIFKGSSGPIGATMAFASGAAFAAGAALVYRRWKNQYGLIGGLLLGTVLLTVSMITLNYYWALGAWGVPQSAHLITVKTTTLPFNLYRGLLSSVIIYPLYLALRRPLARWLD